MRDDEAQQRELYLGSCARLVRVVGAVTGDRVEAEDAVMDAFVRLVDRWPQVGGYQDPEAWVRKVALGYVSNRRRKVRNGLRAALRHGASDDVPGPTPDRVDLARALGQLSRPHREVIVLQDLGLDLATIADELGLPLGTVKSRLSRARRLLVPLLTEDLTDHV